MSIAKYLRWKDEDGTYFRPVSLTGAALLNDRTLNKSTAFTEQERIDFDLVGLLPPMVQTFDAQLKRNYEGFFSEDSNISNYVFLRALQDRNETLFYALVSRHLDEMTPIIYTPTVGLACQEFSHRFQKTRGLYISPQNVSSIAQMAHHFSAKDIKIIVVTDSKAILGIGDQGVGGMGIPIGKLSLYTLGAGIHPASCLPIVLDVGTDNESLLNDPMYLGMPHRRMTGEAYDTFIATFVAQVKHAFPKAVLQWEDFSKSDAFNNLERYHETLPSFNDDIQGTGAVVLAGVIGANRIKNERISDQIYAIYGAGAGGVGVANQIHAGLVRDGLTPEQATDRIFILDSQGVVLTDRSNLDEFKRTYAKSRIQVTAWTDLERVNLESLLTEVPVTVLIGTSGIGQAFTETHVSLMLRHSDRPIIFPLSNPTTHSEAIPEDLYKWSSGQAIVATGSPYEPVTYKGVTHRVGQGNNVFIFPGVGLAAILSKVSIMDKDMFTTAAFELAQCLTDEQLANGSVYPEIHDLRTISFRIAKAVLEEMLEKDSSIDFLPENLDGYLAERMWEAEYMPYRRV